MKKTVILIVGGMMAFAASAEENHLTDVSKPIQAGPSNPIVEIHLPANPTTGYQWILYKYDPELLEPLSSQYFPPPKKLIGAPGYTAWKFKLKNNAFIVPQQTTIVLQYVRPWELTDNHQQSVRIITHAE